MKNKIDKKTVKKGLLPYLFLFIIMLGIIYVLNFVNKDDSRRLELPDVAVKAPEHENINEVMI